MRVDRRTFLGLGGGALAAVALRSLPGCGDDLRRPFAGQALAEAARFPDGVIAGSPRPRGIHLVVMVTELSGSARLGLEVARDAGFDDVVLRGVVDLPARVQVVADVPLHVALEDEPELAPGRRYFYRWVTTTTTSPVGRFTTLRDAGDERPLRLGFFSCQGWQAGYFTAHHGLAAEDVDLVVSLGDYIYDLTDDTGPPERVDSIGPARRGFAETVQEYRQKYRLYRSDAGLQAMHARHAMLAVWDNHELAEDGGHLGELTPRVALAQRFQNGRAAFWDAMPMDEGPTQTPLYRRLRIGAFAELFLLDLHSYAGDPGSGESYLGRDQRDWLLDGLSTSQARWKLIATSTVMMGLELSAGSPVNLNQWDGFPDERRAIVEHVRAGGIQGVLALSGDLHTFLAAPVTTTGRADGQAGLVEISGGAISSQGLLDLEENQGGVATLLEDAARGANPHLAYINALARGYAVLELGRDEARVTLRSPASVLVPRSPVRDLARLRIPYGEPRVEVVYAETR